MSNLNQTTALITGASSGIGHALAIELASQGVSIALLARRKERLEQLSEELKGRGQHALALTCDVTRPNELKTAVAATVSHFGKLDIVVANAGFGVAGELEKLSVEDYHRQFDTNIFGVLNTIYATLEELKKSKGVLVILGSVSGYVPLAGTSPYSMSKAAVHALSHALSSELRVYGVSVVLIVPGFVDSEIRRVDNIGSFHSSARDPIPQWLRMESSKAARQIRAAIEDRKQEKVITFHGKIIVFVQRHFPGLLSAITRKGIKGRTEPKT